jgi:fructokinase
MRTARDQRRSQSTAAVVGDMERWATAAERFYRTATIIKASDEDVRAARGGRVSVAEAAVYWLDCGARWWW